MVETREFKPKHEQKGNARIPYCIVGSLARITNHDLRLFITEWLRSLAYIAIGKLHQFEYYDLTSERLAYYFKIIENNSD